MSGSLATPSPQLVEANRRLYALRVQVKAQDDVDCAAPWDVNIAQEPAADKQRPMDVGNAIAALPSHLGWENNVITAVLRRRQQELCRGDEQEWFAGLAKTFPDSTNSAGGTCSTPLTKQQCPLDGTQASDWVKLYPDIGLGMLRQELAAPGRLWLALRFLDQDGCGLLRIDITRKHLTRKTSTLRLCGKRQLRNLLQDGEGVYWTRDKKYIWLRSAAKVAHELGVDRLTGRPVALPVAALLDGIGTFRAHLYTAFHSGRTKDTQHDTQAMPIARDTLAGLSGVGRSSQRAYEARAGLEVQANFAVGDLSTKENQENRAWEKGQALFELKDYGGQQGKKGRTYLAWQLPNTYIGQHQQRPRGRQKRINRELKDLVMKGMPGNVGGASETRQPEKVYYPNGKLAARAYGRDPEQELYWRRHKTQNGRFELWQQLGGSRC
jgi:hypothetical protein